MITECMSHIKLGHVDQCIRRTTWIMVNVLIDDDDIEWGIATRAPKFDLAHTKVIGMVVTSSSQPTK